MDITYKNSHDSPENLMVLKDLLERLAIDLNNLRNLIWSDTQEQCYKDICGWRKEVQYRINNFQELYGDRK